MQVDISSLLKEVGSKFELNIEEPLDLEDEEIKLNKPVKIKGYIINTGQSLLLNGTVSTEIMLECARCLKIFGHPLKFNIEEQYCKSGKDYKEITGEVELTEEAFVYLIGDDNTIDLKEILRQNIIANLPMKALCKKTCPGIEIKKEKDLQLDPRLAKLKEIKEKYRREK